MKICPISPVGYSSPGLFETFPKPFKQHGHEIIQECCVRDADVVFFDCHSGFAPYDSGVLDDVLARRIPVVVFDAFDYWGSPSHRPPWTTVRWWEGHDVDKLRSVDWALFVKNAYEQNLVKVHFMRKMQESVAWPRHVRQLNLCGYPDHVFPLATKEELAARPFDVCFIGASSPWRANFVCDLLCDGRLKVDYFWPVHRIEHADWLNRHRQARMFIEADGGGFGSERPYQLMHIAPMLRQHNDQHIHEDWQHRIDCLDMGDTWGRLDTQNIDVIVDTVGNPDALHQLYVGGAKRLENHFSFDARATYVLDTLKELL